MSAAARAAAAVAAFRRRRRPFHRQQRDELAGELAGAEARLARDVWLRAPDHDRRIRNGDDFAGDAWVNAESGRIRFVAVGQRP